MKHVLWISRHTMTQEQRADLERALHDKVRIHQYPMLVSDVRELDWVVAQSDVICAVLPIEKLHELMLVVGERPVLVSKAKQRKSTDEEFVFEHDGWYQMIDISIVKQRL